jgi:glucokinase
VGLDIGGTKLSAAVVDDDGAVLVTDRAPTPAVEGPEVLLDAAAALVRTVWSRATPLVGGRVTDDATGAGGGAPPRLGVGTAGVVDSTTGRIVSATSSLAGWAGTDVRAGLGRRLDGAGVEVVNDVNAFALGEGWTGAAAGVPDFLAVTVGTGIGGAVVVGGRALPGAHHFAGEIGHMTSPQAAGLPCPCGKHGHLEAVAAGPGMVRAYRSLGGSAVTAHDVARALAAGDERALAVVRAAGAALGTALASVAAVLDPAVVVVGGGALAVGDELLAATRRAVVADAMPGLEGLELRPATLHEPVAVGAARLVAHHPARDVLACA